MKHLLTTLALATVIMFSLYGYMTHKLCQQDHTPEQLKAMQLDCSKPWFMNL